MFLKVAIYLYFQFLIEKQREEEAKMKEQVAKKS